MTIRELRLRALARYHRALHRCLVSIGDMYRRAGLYEASASWLQVAAAWATYNPCGLYVSPPLEDALAELRVISSRLAEDYPRSAATIDGRSTVLHVATELYPTGGHTRLIWRWICQDRSRRHDVVLTRARNGYVPPDLADAVQANGGTVTILDFSAGICANARHLRRIAASFDAVLLHIHPFDLCACLAFGAAEDESVAFINHADHGFWLGARVAKCYVNFRESGESLCAIRRGVGRERSIRICLPLDLSTNTSSDRAAARRSLGLPPNGIVLLSVGADHKFGRGYDQPSIRELVEPVLLRESDAQFVAVGAGDSRAWKSAHRRMSGRVQALPTTEQISLYYAASDAYLDTYPMTSPTALLECGAMAIPALAFVPHQGIAKVYSCDAPGTQSVYRASSPNEYQGLLTKFIQSATFRHEAGRALQEEIKKAYAPREFAEDLRRVYTHLALDPGGRGRNTSSTERRGADGADLYLLQYHLAGQFCRSLGYLVVNYADGLGRFSAGVRLTARAHFWLSRLTGRSVGYLNVVCVGLAYALASTESKVAIAKARTRTTRVAPQR